MAETEEPMTCAVYDGECPICRTAARVGQRLDRDGRMHWVSSHDHEALAALGIDPERAAAERSILVFDRATGGPPATEVRAIAEISRDVPLIGPILARALMTAAPVLNPAYRVFARNRHRISGVFARIRPSA
jgi:predicted DCC family thiol-disulfide oxidoreductase YuxK